MKKMRRIAASACIALTSLFILSSLAILSSCSEGEKPDPPKPKPPTPPAEQTKIPINIATGAWTKATDSGFETGDKVGIYVVNYTGATSPGTLASTGNHATNIGFTYGTSWTADSQIYWKDQTTKADFYCYYPYVASIADVSAYQFNVRANQSTLADYKASDFLWGKTAGVSPTSDPVQITIKHAMSNLIVRLTPGNGYTAADLTNAVVKIKNLKTRSVINLTTGSASATGTAEDMTPRKETDYYRALLVPQTITNLDLIVVELGSDIYTLKQSITFEANKQHTCTIVLNKSNGGVTITIGNWETDGNDHGGTVS